MSCVCQYFGNNATRTIPSSNCIENGVDKKNLEENVEPQIKERECSSTSTRSVSATELAAARAEIWVLTKNLTDAQISIESLESFLKCIIDKQNALLSELYALKRINSELQEESRMQRDYHTIERNAIIRELHNIKTLLSSRAALLEEARMKNAELQNAVQDANEKIYVIGMKFLKLKTSRSRQCSERSATTSTSEVIDESPHITRGFECEATELWHFKAGKESEVNGGNVIFQNPLRLMGVPNNAPENSYQPSKLFSGKYCEYIIRFCERAQPYSDTLRKSNLKPAKPLLSPRRISTNEA
uniref:Uncharacterized protein n=1 Tax=Glossina pallidipes TaxID=7398 RepID=A0A1B0A0D7_GLOPL